MERKHIDWWVGGFVLVGLTALAFLSMQVGNLANFSDNQGYAINAAFDNVGGLKAKALVKIGGVEVGRVHSIEIDPKSYQAVVKMQIQAGVKLPVDTGASIYTAGLLGDQYVTLEPGGAEDNLKPGGKVQITQSAVILEQLIGQLLFEKAAKGEQDSGS